jgi:PAS domain S-box-containing protein
MLSALRYRPLSALSYAYPVILVLTAALARAALHKWIDVNVFTFGFFYLAVAASTWFWTFRHGLVALVTAALISAFQLEPSGSFSITPGADQVRWAGFLAVSLAICLMIDSRNRQKEKAINAEATLGGLIKAAPVGIALFDADLRYVLINERLAAINGIPAKDHIGKTVAEVLPNFEPLVRKHFEDCLRSAKSNVQFEITGETPAAPGVQRTWMESWFPVLDEDGRAVGVGAIVEEVTQAREQERAMQELSARKSEFLAVLGHEVRSPLGALSNALEVIAAVDKKDAAESIGLARRQISRIKRMADDLFDASRLQAGKLSLDKRTVDLSQLISDSVQTVRPHIQAKNQLLKLKIPSNVHLTGDFDRLCQAFTNILGNASKFTPEGGNIQLTGRLVDQSIEVAIRDDGVGIPPEALSKIFDMWAQAIEGGRHSGLGIGLALSKQIVELHGGEITATSEGENRGSTFTVKLPAEATSGKQ